MKQAVLITAYKNINSLYKLINQFPKEYFNVYVHFDKKNIIYTSGFDQSICKSLKYFSTKFNVNWGSRNHLLAILHLSEIALSSTENYYFHLITGDDRPAKDLDYFINGIDISKDYLQTVEYPVSYMNTGGRDWFEYYNYFDVLDAKKYLKYIRFIKNIQIKFGIKRSFDNYFLQKYYGSTYWSLTRDTLQHVIDYTQQKPGFLRRLKHTFCSEELYIPTVVLNSHRAGNVINDNLRFIKWDTDVKTGSPKVLDDSDWPEILSSGKLFARKFDK
jgi:hypothetical protein